MRIAIVTAFHEREETTRIVCESLERLANEAAAHDFLVEIYAVYDGSQEYQAILATHLDGHAYYDNHPISNRMNAACGVVLGEPDAIIFLGGDNIINLPYLLWVKEQIEGGADVAAPLDCYFYRKLTGEQAYWSGYEGSRQGEPIGAGRAISRRVLEKVDWQPWPMGLDANLDGAMWDRIRHFVSDVRTVQLTDIGGVVLDIKDEQGNINDWHHLHRHATMIPCEIPHLEWLLDRRKSHFPPMPWFENSGGAVALTMIARARDDKEVAALRRALYSASAICGSAAVVLDDTSSGDAERVCSAAGCSWIHRKWDRDFSAARNYAGNLAQRWFPEASWHLVLDADEELVVAPGLDDLMADRGIEGIALEVHIATDQGPVIQPRSTRLYRPENAWWERPIHNRLKGLDPERVVSTASKVVTSYKGVMKERADRQLPVLMEELLRDPNDLHTLKYLVRTLCVLEHWDNAEMLANRLVGLAPDDPLYSDVYLHLASFARRRGDFGRVFGTLVEGIKKHSQNPEMWRHMLGICLQGFVGASEAPGVYDGTSRMMVPDLPERAAEVARMLQLPVTVREATCPSASEESDPQDTKKKTSRKSPKSPAS